MNNMIKKFMNDIYMCMSIFFHHIIYVRSWIPKIIKLNHKNNYDLNVCTMLRTKNLQEYDFDDMDPWSELLGSVAWDIRSTHHTTLQATPGQLVFGRHV